MGTIALTPAMILDWCHALVWLKYFRYNKNISTSLQDEGQATLTTPPNIPLFNVENKAHFLHPTRKAQPPPAPTPTPSVDVNSVMSILPLQMLTNSGLLPSASSPAATKAAPDSVPSAVPAVSSVHKPPLPLPFPSPTQLKRFLSYAETELGVHDASQYKDALDLRGIGPDVLAEMSDHILSDIGIPAGDIVCLKKGSIAWWNGPDAK